MKKEANLLMTAVALLSFSANSFCQIILYPEIRPPNARFDNFIVKNGEANQASTSILIDHLGFVWTGTETGLYRFDGATYVEYGVSMDDSTGFYGYGTNCLFEDTEGFIWLGTSEALNRLDQKTGTFRHYFPDPSRKNPANNCLSMIAEDREGLLWIRTDKDLFSFNKKKETFRQYVVEPPVNNKQSPIPYPEYFLTEDASGNKYFIARQQLHRLDVNSDEMTTVFPLQDNPDEKVVGTVNSMITDRNGIIWIGTGGGGLYRWKDTVRRPERIRINPEGAYSGRFNDVSSVYEDKRGRIWAFGNYAFSVFDPSDESLKNYTFDHDKRIPYETEDSEAWIEQVFERSDGTIWFFNKAWGSMYRFNPADESFSLYRTPNYMIFKCVIDETESFWFASIRNNLFRLVTGNMPFTIVNIINQSEVDPVHKNKILEDPDHNIWIASKNYTFIIPDFSADNSITFTSFRLPDGDTLFRSIIRDSRGNMWFGGRFGKVTKYNPETRRSETFLLYKSEEKTSYDGIPLIKEDKAGNIWFAPYERGLFRYNPLDNKIESVITYRECGVDSINHTMIDFLIDNQDDLWLLTISGVISIKMPGLTIHEHRELYPGGANYNNRNIRIMEDSRNNLWLLQEIGGIFLFDRDSGVFRKHPVDDKSPAGYYYDMQIDNRDRIWVGHNMGITILDPLSGYSRTIPIPRLQYDLHSYLTSSGLMLYINDNQLLVFNENIPVNSYIPPVHITSLKVNGEDYRNMSYGYKKNISLRKADLPYRYNSIEIGFAALNYLNPELNMYRYFMEGMDRDTMTVASGETAEYKMIPPGKYRFWVTGSNNDGIWNKSGAFLDIKIQAPWYRSVAAYISYGLLAIALIIFYIRLRTYRLRKEKKKLEAEIEARTRDLEIKNRQLAEIDSMKTHFFTDISHEIRTPLSLITGPLETLTREETLTERGSKMVEMIRRNSLRLSQLVNQLLDISRLDAGKMKVNLSEGDLLKSLRILVYDYLSFAESKHIRYIADIPDGELLAFFDRDKIEKIVSNLLSNAFKFTPCDGVIHCKISIEQSLQLKVIIRVKDSGPGIDNNHIKKIFDRFYRIEERHETHTRGTGIGLSLVNEFVKLLHGEISVNSEPGKGSEFVVIVPIGKDHLTADEYTISQIPSAETLTQQRHEPEKKTASAANGLNADSKLSILIIEDNEDLRNFIKESLSDEYRVMVSDNGNTGFNMALTMIPDIIITDIMMPGIDGILLCKQIKSNILTSHIPVIMLTARASMDDKLEGLSSGADDYLIKPFSILELKTRISNMLIMREKLKTRYSRFRQTTLNEKEFFSVDDAFMSKVLKIINDNISNFDLDVGFLQDKIGMSRVHLTRKLKVLTGTSPGMIIRNIRMETAADLIAQNYGNITEVANRVGISNPSHFTKAFTKHFGVSPRNYGRSS